jgi:SAM-dependent methyltransferase
VKSAYIDDLERLDISNFWFTAKERYLKFIIDKPGSVILDAGCGSGRNLTSFIDRGFEVVGIDINKRAVTLCREKGYKSYLADIQHETIPGIQPSPDYIVALDLLEHMQKPVQALRNLRKCSHMDTKLIVTVPSYQFLFSKWDQEMRHVKRYTRTILCKELEDGGWKVSRSTYIHFVPLIPAILLRKIINPIINRVRPPDSNVREHFTNPHPLLNSLLIYLYYPEFYCFQKRIPLLIGLSVMAIATPKGVGI